VTLDYRDERLIIIVRDDGVGIADEDVVRSYVATRPLRPSDRRDHG
jgi:hypothetical protein